MHGGFGTQTAYVKTGGNDWTPGPNPLQKLLKNIMELGFLMPQTGNTTEEMAGGSRSSNSSNIHLEDKVLQVQK